MCIVGSASPSGHHTTYESANHMKRWKIMAEVANRFNGFNEWLLTRRGSGRLLFDKG